jgi:hypothetical protein
LVKTRLAVVFAAFLTVGCNDLLTDARKVEPPAPPPGDTAQAPTRFQAITCTVTVDEAKVVCGDPVRTPDGVDADLIVGGQHVGLLISSESFTQSASSKVFTMWVGVRNQLVKQPLGTVDGTTVDPRGVRVFFASGPHATVGTGSVAISNPDGVGTFTASRQPYFQYSTVLDQFEVSTQRPWIFTTGPDVSSFTFTAYVSAPVEYPDGWIDVTPSVFPIRPTNTWTLQAVVRDVVGDPISNAPVVWSIADPVRATLQPDGTVTGRSGGITQVTATSGDRTGFSTLNVGPILRTWTAAAGTTDYRTDNNWAPAAFPVEIDTLLIPLVAPLDPVLTLNVMASSITVEDGAILNINAFDLTSTGDVHTGIASGQGIVNSSGRLILAGSAKTVQGRLPRTRVTGTYSVTGNVTTRAPLEIFAGRLTNSTYRVQVESL